jgi:hypothetical protein
MVGSSNCFIAKKNKRTWEAPHLMNGRGDKYPQFAAVAQNFIKLVYISQNTWHFIITTLAPMSGVGIGFLDPSIGIFFFALAPSQGQTVID